jgi:transcriptional regulator with XRE-family HTH domain
MRSEFDFLDELLQEGKSTHEGLSISLRIDLSRIIISRLKAKGWSQRELGLHAELKAPFVSRIVNGDANCTFDTAAKLLFALGVEAGLLEKPPGAPSPNALRYQSDVAETRFAFNKVNQSGPKKIKFNHYSQEVSEAKAGHFQLETA